MPKTPDPRKVNQSPESLEREFFNSPIAREQLKAQIDDLPVRQHQDEIMEAIYQNQAVILVAEPGTGKSTQIGQILNERGYEDVVIAEPRIVLARTLAHRVAFEMGQDINESVGYKTALEKSTNDWKPITFCTPGYASAARIRPGSPLPEVLVIDEAHERSIDIDVLMAIARDGLKSNPQSKVIIMSATIDAEPLSKFFGNAPIINIPGRQHALTKINYGPSVVEDIAGLVNSGQSGLMIVYGKAEIEKYSQLLEDAGVDAVILPMHSELTVPEQERCFADYGRPKVIIATDIVRYGVTVPGISFVYDLGIKNEARTNAGVSGLYKVPVSQAEIIQGSNRACREGPGVSVVRSDIPLDRRPRFPTPEIDREPLDQVVLRLAAHGLRIEDVALLKTPPPQAIKEARQFLIDLGALDKEGQPTEVGLKMARLPVSSRMGRMLVEAEKLGCLRDMIPLAAIMEAGGVTNEKSSAWRALCQGENKADPIAQLAVYRSAQLMVDDAERESNGVHVRNFLKISQMDKHIQESFGNIAAENGAVYNREKLVRALTAGLADRIFVRTESGYVGGTGSLRILSRDSIVTDAPLLAAQPFNLEILLRQRDGEGRRAKPGAKRAASDPLLETRMLHLIQHAVEIDPAILPDVAPALARVVRESAPMVNPHRLSVSKKVDVEYRDDRIFSGVKQVSGPEAVEILANWLSEKTISGDVPRETHKPLKLILKLNHALVKEMSPVDLKSSLDSIYRERLSSPAFNINIDASRLALSPSDLGGKQA